MPAVKATIEALTEAGLRDQVKVRTGGAPVTRTFAKQIGRRRLCARCQQCRAQGQRAAGPGRSRIDVESAAMARIC